MSDWMIDEQNRGTDFLNRAATETPNRWNTPSDIQTFSTHDPGQGDITRLPEGRTTSSVTQTGDANQLTTGGGSISPGCILIAVALGVIVAITIIVAGIL